MKYYIFFALLAISAAAVHFSANAPTSSGIGIEIPVTLSIQNTEPVYGYEITLTSYLEYRSHQFLTNNTASTLVKLNQTSLRIAVVVLTGIPNGTTDLLQINFTANQTGNYSISISSTAYHLNGSAMQTNSTSAVIRINSDELRIESETASQRTASVGICMQNSKQIDQTVLTIEYNASRMTLISSSVPRNGNNILLQNIPAHQTCEKVAELEFEITAKPGSTIPIIATNLTTTSPYPIIKHNGFVKYASFYIECANTTAYRNTAAQVTVSTINFTKLDSLQYTINTTFDIIGATSDGEITVVNNTVNEIMNGTESQIILNVTNQPNGQYKIALEQVAATSANETIQSTPAECTLTITTNCHDLDNDTYYTGAECTQNQTDCDDTRAAIYPGAAERCNNLDDDCDTLIDEGEVCKAVTKTGGGGGGGASSSGSAGSAGAASAGGAGFIGMPIPEEEAYMQPEPLKEAQTPIRAQLENGYAGNALIEEPKPKRINLIANALGFLIILAAGIFLAYEYLKKHTKKKKR